MSDPRCKCSMAISATGDGCRYCQPQEYIDRLEEWLDEDRQKLAQAETRADACQLQAQIWKQEARAQSSTVAEIYQELTGKTGEPGDWNGVRPLKPAILRKQAEAVEQAAMCFGGRDFADVRLGLSEQAQQLRQQADELEKGGEGCQ